MAEGCMDPGGGRKMKLTTRVTENIAIVSIEGDFDASTSAEVNECLMSTLEQGNAGLIIDLEGVPFMSSRGLRVLLEAYRAGKLSDTSVVIAAPSKGVKKVLDISGFSSFLTCYPDIEKAISSLLGAENELSGDIEGRCQ